jgi:hypothetical protein
MKKHLELRPSLLLRIVSLEVPLPGNDGLLPLPRLVEARRCNYLPLAVVQIFLEYQVDVQNI